MVSSQRKLLALQLAALPERDRYSVVSVLSATEQIALNALIAKASRLPIVAHPELIKHLSDAINETSANDAGRADLQNIRNAAKVWQRYAAATLSVFEQELIDVKANSTEKLPPMLCAAIASALTETQTGNAAS